MKYSLLLKALVYFRKFLAYKNNLGVPIVAQWKQIQLETMRLWVQSLASISGLRIQRCCELWCRSQMGLGRVAMAVV